MENYLQTIRKNKTQIIRWGIRIIALLVLVGFFIPYFCVSCSSETQNISALQLTTGMDLEYEEIEPHPAVLFLFLAPIAVIVLSFFISKIKPLLFWVISLACAIIQFIINGIIHSSIMDYCAELLSYGIELKFKAGYHFMNWYGVLLIILIVFDFIFSQNIDYAKLTTTTVEKIKDVTAAIPSSKYCTFCGQKISSDATFCMHCGKPQNTVQPDNVPTHETEIKTESEEKSVPINEPTPVLPTVWHYCTSCGNKVDNKNAFCSHCGAKQ